VKLHDLRPADGSHTPRTRVGRGIAAGKGKTAGRGTKGQKARTGGTIAAWFEGGQTPVSQRIPKLHGFKRRFRIEYEVVNIGRIDEVAAAGGFGDQIEGAPIAVNPDLLVAAGLVGTLRRPVKVLGQGDVDRRLFIVADAFSASARTKIEAAGGTAQVLEVPDESLPALGTAPLVSGARPGTARAGAPAPAAEPGVQSGQEQGSAATPEAE
jgi:large subunit ribosomal protein L15